MNRQRGFTLIEALVAMTIIAVALIACLKAAGNLNIQQDDMIKRQYAQWSAKNAAQLHSRVGRISQRTKHAAHLPQGNFRFVCLVEITNTPNPNFRRVEIQVKDAFEGDKGNQLARLVIFLSSAP
jgi:general secretion pathway protein I